MKPSPDSPLSREVQSMLSGSRSMKLRLPSADIPAAVALPVQELLVPEEGEAAIIPPRNDRAMVIFPHQPALEQVFLDVQRDQAGPWRFIHEQQDSTQALLMNRILSQIPEGDSMDIAAFLSSHYRSHRQIGEGFPVPRVSRDPAVLSPDDRYGLALPYEGPQLVTIETAIADFRAKVAESIRHMAQRQSAARRPTSTTRTLFGNLDMGDLSLLRWR